MKSFPSSSGLALAVAATLVSASAPDPGAPWTTTLFLDDFDGSAGSAPDSSNWIIDTGTSYPGGPAAWGTGEIETYTSDPSNVGLDGNGNLLITPQLDTSTGAWTSARIETVLDSFVAPVGGMMRLEASVQAPAVSSANGMGYWPAFWVLGSGLRANYQGWPGIGEFDIMEIVNGGANTGHGMHCGTDPGGPCNEPDGIYEFDNCPNSACSGNWHTYTLIHDRTSATESVQFQVDGQTLFTVSESQTGTDTWQEAVDNGMYIVANVAMGGALPNAIAQATTPNSDTQGGVPMMIDYVAVWTTDATNGNATESTSSRKLRPRASFL